MTDTDPIPFGKFKGHPMQDVPVEYLHYLWQSGMKNDQTGQVACYIRTNLNALKMENGDLIWS